MEPVTGLRTGQNLGGCANDAMPPQVIHFHPYMYSSDCSIVRFCQSVRIQRKPRCTECCVGSRQPKNRSSTGRLFGRHQFMLLFNQGLWFQDYLMSSKKPRFSGRGCAGRSRFSRRGRRTPLGGHKLLGQAVRARLGPEANERHALARDGRDHLLILGILASVVRWLGDCI